MDTLHSKILIILILGAVLAICQVSAASRNPSDCCLSTNQKKFPYRLISSYRQQDSSSGCNIDAVVFTTHKNRHICAPPNSGWAKKYMDCLRKQMSCTIVSGLLLDFTAHWELLTLQAAVLAGGLPASGAE
ncbi:PREDICTED: C-C motif chemokine 19-like [Nanorana parkeri]|uniref:C-C motif chemokine 19-like n=1 Tax=Nanorana parkeri TaxID=125878 RepID=UPI000853FAD3|nr:PREDICTED: C-C motif chemokine 19-like [Nanorana parkeri]